MDKLGIFNNEELLELYDKVNQEIDHLNECIIVEDEEPEVEEPVKEEVSEETTEDNNTEEEKEEKEEENNEQS